MPGLRQPQRLAGPAPGLFCESHAEGCCERCGIIADVEPVGAGRILRTCQQVQAGIGALFEHHYRRAPRTQTSAGDLPVARPIFVQWVPGFSGWFAYQLGGLSQLQISYAPVLRRITVRERSPTPADAPVTA